MQLHILKLESKLKESFDANEAWDSMQVEWVLTPEQLRSKAASDHTGKVIVTVSPSSNEDATGARNMEVEEQDPPQGLRDGVSHSYSQFSK